MNNLTIACMIIALIVTCIGGIMLAVAGFRTGFMWGMAFVTTWILKAVCAKGIVLHLACLGLGIVQLVFVVKFWSEAKKGFLMSMAGLVVGLGFIFSSPDSRAGFWRGFNGQGASAASKEKELTAQIEGKRSHVSSLQQELAKVTADSTQQYQELSRRRGALDPKDKAAVEQFNAEAAAYQKKVERLREISQEVDAGNVEVAGLLAKREAEKKQVVIYSTSWCGACQAAKRYMDGKGIKYRNVDVEQSPEGAEEYRREGGDGGVPLIVVGGKKLKGFNPAELESML